MKLTRSIARTAVIVAAFILVPTGPASAHADQRTSQGGSASYQCQGEYDPEAAPTPVTFDLLSQPTSLRPGDALSLKGVLSITLSDSDAQESQAMLTQKANIDATDFNLVVQVGGRTLRLKPSLVVGRPTPVASPFVLTADVSYPELTIPRSATGVVTVGMPVEAGTTTEVPGAPAKVTFTAHLRQDSPLVDGRTYACWADHLDSRARVARIPLSPTRDPGSNPSTPPPPPPPASGDLTGAAPPPPAYAPAPVGVPPAVTPVELAPPQAAPVSTATRTTFASAPIPPATASGDTFVPGWIVALFVALFPAAAVSYAITLHRRLRRLSVMTTTTS